MVHQHGVCDADITVGGARYILTGHVEYIVFCINTPDLKQEIQTS